MRGFIGLNQNPVDRLENLTPRGAGGEGFVENNIVLSKLNVSGALELTGYVVEPVAIHVWNDQFVNSEPLQVQG